MTQANVLAQLGAQSGPTFRNRIINGAMVIDQRNAGASVTPTTLYSTYTLDRWQSNYTSGSKFSVQQNAGSVTPPAGFTNYLGVTSLSAYSVPSGELYRMVQQIEGYNIADLGFGTANAKTVTLSFWVRSSLTGTFGGAFLNSDASRSYPFNYTISSANTWEQKTVTIAGDTTGTWNTTNGSGLQVDFALGVGATYSGTAGSWSGSVYYSATGSTNILGTNGATFYITGVQLEVGSSATGFEYVNYQTSLANCQRYYAKLGGTTATETLCLGFATDLATAQYYCVYFPVTMRSAPTAAYSSVNTTDLANGSVTVNSIRGQLSGVNTCQLGFNTSSAAWLTTYNPMAAITATTAGYISLSAEL